MRAAVLLVAALVAGCGSSCPPSAGGACNGQTIDTYVHWTLIAKQYDWFNETPDGVGAASVKLDVSGPMSTSVTVNASFSQAKFSDLPAGMYTVRGTLLDPTNTPITKGMAHTSFVATGSGGDVFIDFPYEDFIKTYTGTYYFQVTWGGEALCATAGVVKQRLLLTRAGVPVAGMTIDGDKLDGTSMRACQDGTSREAAVGLLWGPARMTISGLDQTNNVIYMGTFDTFVGADLANPPAIMDVTSLLPDAGVVDAMGSDL